MSFIDDIQGQNTQLYPVVKIGEGWYSTNNVTVGDNYCKPILMNIPSIKESIGIESRKFKISNVSLQFNNFPFDGVRFSDQLSESSLINTEATIYFKSPSTTTIPDDENPLDTDLKEVYKGIIRRISHDDTKVKIELEDLTEQKAHRDLPIKSLGGGNSIPDKYKHVPIPIVYGHVDRSPVVISENFRRYQADSRRIRRFIESNSDYTNATGDGIWLDALQVDMGGEIFHIKRGGQCEWEESGGYGDDSIHLLGSVFGASEAATTVDETSLILRGIISPKVSISQDSSPELSTEDFLSGESSMDNIVAITDGSLSENPISLTSNAKYDVVSTVDDGVYGAEDVALTQLDFNFDVTPSHNTVDNKNTIIGFKINGYNLPKFLGGKRTLRANHSTAYTPYSSTDGYDNNIIWQNACHHADIIEEVFSFINHTDGSLTTTAGSYTNAPDNYPSTDADIQFNFTNVGDVGHNDNGLLDIAMIVFWGHLDNKLIMGFRTVGDAKFLAVGGQIDYHADIAFELTGNMDEVGFLVENEATKLFNNDFYANVEGRVNLFADHPIKNGIIEGTETVIENPIDIIYDLVRSELGHHAIDEAEYLEARAAHNGWKFAFTQSTKTPSKKLIEEIAKSTKCFPRFKSDGTFGFNTIKDSYYCLDVHNIDGENIYIESDYSKATQIKKLDVISYSFKKTKPEQLYQKVDVLYKKDYANDTFMKRSTPATVIYGDGQDEANLAIFYLDVFVVKGNPKFYGIDLAVDNESDSYLEFESDYIRDEYTANELTKFLIGLHHNDHLIANIKLPLNYIDLEVGSLVKFRELLDGKAFGIDYRGMQAPNVNQNGDGQYYYPLFMVTSTKKNLNSIEIECIQLHWISDNYAEYGNTYTGWFDSYAATDTYPAGLFYFPESEISLPDPPFIHEAPETEYEFDGTILIGHDSGFLIEGVASLISSYKRALHFIFFLVDGSPSDSVLLSSIFESYFGGLGALGVTDYNDLMPAYNTTGQNSGTYGDYGRITSGQKFRDFVALEIIFESAGQFRVAKLQNIFNTIWDEGYEPTLVSDANPSEGYINEDYVPGNPYYGGENTLDGYWHDYDSCDEIKLGWVIYKCDSNGTPENIRDGKSPSELAGTFVDAAMYSSSSPEFASNIFISLWSGFTRHLTFFPGEHAHFGDYQLSYSLPSPVQFAYSMRGDVNLDGGIDILDLHLVTQHFTGGNQLTGQALENADVREDGMIDILDVVTLVGEILNP